MSANYSICIGTIGTGADMGVVSADTGLVVDCCSDDETGDD